MVQNEVEFLFKARDEVSKVLNTLNAQIEQTGAVSAKTARATSDLTRFVREQRTEQRLQNFLFREGAQAMGALSLGLSLFGSATSDANRAQKELSNSLNAGFLAFQGISFALSGLNPAIGLTLGAVAGLAAAMGEMNAQSAASEKRVGELNIAIAQLQKELGLITSDQYIRGLNRELGEAQKRFQAVDGATIDWFATLKAGGIPQFKVNLEGMRQAQVEVLSVQRKVKEEQDAATKATEDNQKKNKSAIDEFLVSLDEQDASFRRLHDTVFPRQAAQNKQVQDKIDLYRELGGVLSFQKIIAEGGGAQKQILPLPKVDEINASFGPVLNVTDHIVENFQNMGTVAQQSADVITNTMVGAADIMAGVFVGAFDRIEDAFKALIQSMIAELIKIGLLKLFSGIVAGAVGGPLLAGGVVGTAVGRTAARAAGSENAGSTITINVTSEFRSVTVIDRRRMMRTIEEAIFTEK